MIFSKRTLLKSGAALAASTGLPLRGLAADSLAPGPFRPDWDSLTAQYQAPDWFRDAKFGIWAHWSAQCVPEAGDWYARNMYLQGSKQYDHHLKNYGHPADTGFMEMNNRWKAENWRPERADRSLCQGGRALFRFPGQSSRQFRQFQFALP